MDAPLITTLFTLLFKHFVPCVSVLGATNPPIHFQSDMFYLPFQITTRLALAATLKLLNYGHWHLSEGLLHPSCSRNSPCRSTEAAQIKRFPMGRGHYCSAGRTHPSGCRTTPWPKLQTWPAPRHKAFLWCTETQCSLFRCQGLQCGILYTQ